MDLLCSCHCATEIKKAFKFFQNLNYLSDCFGKQGIKKSPQTPIQLQELSHGILLKLKNTEC